MSEKKTRGASRPFVELDRRWLQAARKAAAHSKHPAVKVGAVITTADRKTILGSAANNPPLGVKVTAARLQPGEKSLWFMCAEKKALAAAQRKKDLLGLKSLKGCRIYSTLMPCHTCAHDIIQAGLHWVYVPENAERLYPKLKRKYRRSMGAAETMFAETGIAVTAIPGMAAKKTALRRGRFGRQRQADK